MGFRVCVVVGGLCLGISWRENEIVKRGKIHEGVSLGGFLYHYHHCSASVSAVPTRDKGQRRTITKNGLTSSDIIILYSCE